MAPQSVDLFLELERINPVIITFAESNKLSFGFRVCELFGASALRELILTLENRNKALDSIFNEFLDDLSGLIGGCVVMHNNLYGKVT